MYNTLPFLRSLGSDFSKTFAGMIAVMPVVFAELELSTTLDELDSDEELVGCSEELEDCVVVFFLATPLAAKSGAYPALIASRAPARYTRGAFQLMATSFVA